MPLEPGRAAGTETIELDPRSVRGLRVRYAPHRDGAPDAGEVVWTWVPYAERDGRGKDRPVLVIATQSADRVYAVKLTSKSHDGDRDFLSLGSGPWDTWVARDHDEINVERAAMLARGDDGIPPSLLRKLGLDQR